MPEKKKTTKATKKAIAKKSTTKKNAAKAKKDSMPEAKKKSKIKEKQEDLPVIKVENKNEAQRTISKLKKNIFKKEWYEQKSSKKKEKGDKESESFADKIDGIRYVRKCHKKNR